LQKDKLNLYVDRSMHSESVADTIAEAVLNSNNREDRALGGLTFATADCAEVYATIQRKRAQKEVNKIISFGKSKASPDNFNVSAKNHTDFDKTKKALAEARRSEAVLSKELKKHDATFQVPDKTPKDPKTPCNTRRPSAPAANADAADGE
jgi:hypothetical protein